MKRLTEVLSGLYNEIESVPKSGYNDFNNYSYVTEPDLVNLIRPKLAEQGIFIYPSVVSQEVMPVNDKLLTLVDMEFTISDSETGESFVCHAQGQGYDNMDKGVYKAITGATKYFLYKLFLIAAGDDPEQNNTFDKGKGQNGGNKFGTGKPSEKQVEFLLDLADEFAIAQNLSFADGVLGLLAYSDIPVLPEQTELNDDELLFDWCINNITVAEMSTAIEKALTLKDNKWDI